MSDADDHRRDWAGVVHATDPAPRIASLVPSITELLFALGLGGRVVARTGFCVHPRPQVRAVPKIGGTKDPDLERLRALAPTHLVVNVDENRREVVDAVRAFVPHVVVTHPVTLDDNPRLYALLGAVFARDAAAAELGRRFVHAREALARRADGWPRERVLYLVWKGPWMTVSAPTYIASTLAATGWDAIAPDPDGPSGARYPVVDEHDPVWGRAQRILLSTEPYAFRTRDAEALTRARQRPVTLIDGEMTSWYGPRAIAGLDYLCTLRDALAGGRPVPAARGQG